jgi:predicted transcriptional regulator
MVSGGEDSTRSGDDERDPENPSETEPPSSSDDPPRPGPRFTYSLFECQECSALALGIRHESTQFVCHDEPMQPVEDDGIDHAEPTLDHLLLDVFDLPKFMLDICHYLFESDIATVAEIADNFEQDQETITNALQELVETGLIEHRELSREGDGHISVYVAKDIEETRRAELISFLHWAGQATMVLDEANEIKEQCLKEDNAGLHQIFWSIYTERRTL